MVVIKTPLDLARFIEAKTSKLHGYVEATIDPDNTLSSVLVRDNCNRLCGLRGQYITRFVLTFDDDGHVDGVAHTTPTLSQDFYDGKRIESATEWTYASGPDEFNDFHLTIYVRDVLGLPLDD